MNGSEICMRQLSRLVVSLCCNHYNKYQIIVNIKLNILKTQTIINNYQYKWRDDFRQERECTTVQV